VPVGSKAAYENAETWRKFDPIIEEIPDGIEETIVEEVKIVQGEDGFTVTGYEVSEPIAIYSANGQLLYSGTIEQGQANPATTSKGTFYIIRIREKSFKVVY
jgi:hypothetical protein